MGQVLSSLFPWLMSVVFLVVGIYCLSTAESNERRLAPRGEEIAVTRLGARYLRSRAYVLVTRGIGVVSVLMGAVGIYISTRGLSQ